MTFGYNSLLHYKYKLKKEKIINNREYNKKIINVSILT